MKELSAGKEHHGTILRSGHLVYHTCIYVVFKEYRNPSPLDYAVEVPASTVDDGSGRSKFLHKHKIVLALPP